MEVRGAILQSMKEFLVDRYGMGNYEYWLHALPDSSQNIFGGKLSENGWYDIDDGLIEPLRLLVKQFYDGLVPAARAIGFYNAEKALTGFLKFVVKRGSPGFVVRQASSILAKYYRPCTTEVPVNEKRHAIVRITEFSRMDSLIEYRIQGWMEKALEVSGCSDVRIEIAKSMARGDEVSEFIGSWA